MNHHPSHGPVCAWDLPWVATALAVQQNRPNLVVVSDGPSSPLIAVRPRGTGWAFELAAAGRSKPGGRTSLSWAGPESRSRCSSCAAPAGPAGTVCNITPETATEQGILEIASRSPAGGAGPST